MTIEPKEGKRTSLPIRVKVPKLKSLRCFGNLLNGQVQPRALLTLPQFYVLHLRSFIFQDFQLAPTLKEYERILGFSLIERQPYLYQGNYPSWAKITKLLKVMESKLAKKRLRRNSVEGLPKAYLEKRMKYLYEMGDWETFANILGLSLFGIVLLPRLDDHATIDTFWAGWEKNKNPMVVVLANTYYTLNNNHEGKGGRMTYYLHTLYLWIIAHIFTSTCKTPCPIEDYKWCFVKILTDQEWAQILRNSSNKTIRWYPIWNEREEVILQCEVFPNIPLIGTQGVPYHVPPERRIIEAPSHTRIRTKKYGNIKKHKMILGANQPEGMCHDASPSYKNWLKNKLDQIGLPIGQILSIAEKDPVLDL
ncbi:hypothetical protein CR513_31072, partial [Mucuna pruriens]